MAQEGSGAIIELSDFLAVGLSFFPAVVQVAELGQQRIADDVRAAAAGIVGEPPTVDGPNQVVSDDNRFGYRSCRPAGM